MRLLARLLMRVLIKISMPLLMKGSILLLMKGSMRLFIKISILLLTCFLVGPFDVSSASITFRTTISDFYPLSYPPQKKLICPKNRLSELLILIGNLRATSDGYKKDNFRYKYARIVKML